MRSALVFRFLFSGGLLGGALALQAEPNLAKDGPFGRQVRELADAGRLSGVVLAAPAGAAPWTVVAGEADTSGTAVSEHTLFNLASVSKLFTAVAIGQLVDQGKIQWSDPVARHLPDFAAEWAARVTIEQLITHTSGLGDYLSDPAYLAARREWRTARDYLPMIARQTLATEPGSGFRYSNAGFIVLGAVIETVTGRRYDDHVTQAVFAPAGMRSTRFLFAESADAAVPVARGFTRRPAGGGPMLLRPGAELPPKREVPFGEPSSAAGGVFSTAGDMLAFARALQDGRLLKPETLNLMTTARVDAPAGRAPPGVVLRHGLGFGVREVNGVPLVGHNGGAPGAAAQLDWLADGTIVVILCNDDLALMPVLRALHEAL